MPAMKRALTAIISLLIVGAGIGVYYYLKSTRPEPKKRVAVQRPTIVRVVSARAAGEPVTVSARGLVIPARVVTITPEVSGRVVYQSPRLVPGGRLAAGELLLRVDPRDYKLAVKLKAAAVAKARVALALEQGQAAVAAQEYKLFGGKAPQSAGGKKLLLREYQLESTRAALEAAEGDLAQSRVRLSRTEIRAPFAAAVTEEFVEQGQVVSMTSRLATLVATDRYWVQASIPLDRLSHISIPGLSGSEGASALVMQASGSKRPARRPGKVIQLLPDLDPRGKMARVLVEVKASTPDSIGIPLLLGGSVSVEIQGRRRSDAIALPRQALRDGGRVWVLAAAGVLQIRAVKAAWSRHETVYVTGDLRPGERVITSGIAAPVEGMKLQAAAAASPDPAPGDKAAPGPAAPEGTP